ncbi:cytochrome c oxidase subunit 3 [Candidatus Thiothrix sp. Deng01]|uniref:cytochrome-c oxidase n=1 Tax=Candidatus Thiothrix phosphatis TaxID=3112415 RepID=A0ABU6D5K2_9GAMM|nr:cytochrome c oxidase subunit 3 [Candidatus Thiothrix sp. Deng01]MEB4593568.1 cytochrome c oxidase subunit 3 [Candidatus Thiothrix sp. Deng01]
MANDIEHSHYYVPERTWWPIMGSVGLTALVAGFSYTLNGGDGKWVMLVGALALAAMLVGWFGQVIHESESRAYSGWEDRTFRLGMSWFIFSEVMFFGAFFGALFYARVLAVPWLGGLGEGAQTHQWLWDSFQAVWPTNGPQKLGGTFEPVPAWGLPALNTLILLSSAGAVTWAHHALKRGNRRNLILGLSCTVLLGFLFVILQGKEYLHAHTELNLSLGSGIYGSTFFMLTGFHGLHVTLGAVMLSVILLRALRGHFTPEHHFAFEAAAWYWHFVDVVWLFLFIFVYWL